jgi:hypothetical protein
MHIIHGDIMPRGMRQSMTGLVLHRTFIPLLAHSHAPSIACVALIASHRRSKQAGRQFLVN